MQSLNPRIRIVWLMQAAMTSAFLALLVAAADYFFFAFGLRAPAIVFAVLFLLTGTHSLLRYRVWRYEIRAHELYLERGVLTRVKTVVPFVRIQHVDSSRSPLERLVGLASTIVYTAGSRGADVVIPGLTPTRSETLQERLKQLAIESEGEDAV